ncbi:hypothetical protein ABZX98_13455 [Streptomyces sp. NPDC002992]|uniref:hypothetical protein n=1 Tax=Streptomyces sp. NPDC002992 TaxID=3154273 RepID=UPI0033A06966
MNIEELNTHEVQCLGHQPIVGLPLGLGRPETVHPVARRRHSVGCVSIEPLLRQLEARRLALTDARIYEVRERLFLGVSARIAGTGRPR